MASVMFAPLSSGSNPHPAGAHVNCRYSVGAVATGSDQVMDLRPADAYVPTATYEAAIVAEHGANETQLSGPSQVVAADMNNDGSMDLVTLSGSGYISWFENEGANSWALQHVVAIVSDAESIALADVDGDGYQDVLVAVGSVGDNGGDKVKLVEHNWGTSYAVRDLLPEYTFGASHIAVADLNNDLLPDVVVVSQDCPDATYDDTDPPTLVTRGTCTAAVQYSLQRAIYATDPTTFTSRQLVASQFVAPAMAALGDLDADGNADLVLAAADRLVWHRSGGGQTGMTIAWSEQLEILGEGVSKVRIVDLDGDGNLDLLCSSLALSQVFWLKNEIDMVTREGGFSAKKLISTNAYGVSDVAAADLDSDGWLDAVYAAESGNSVSYVRSLGGASALNASNIAGEHTMGASQEMAWGTTTLIAGADNQMPIWGVRSIAPILTSCDTCQPGYYANPNTGQGCLGCLPGYHQATAGAVNSESCRACPPGYHSSGAYSNQCTPCDVDSYARAASPRCWTCPTCHYADPAEGECHICHLCTLTPFHDGDEQETGESSQVCHRESNSNDTYSFNEEEVQAGDGEQASAAGASARASWVGSLLAALVSLGALRAIAH